MITLKISFLYVSDLLWPSAPSGRSMFSMTPTSDHQLFIFGGADADRNTLSKFGVFVGFFCFHVAILTTVVLFVGFVFLVLWCFSLSLSLSSLF